MSSNLDIVHAALVVPNGNLYRVIINHDEQGGRLIRHYEVWVTTEAIQSKYSDVADRPDEEQLERFVISTYEDRLKETHDSPEEKGVFISSTQTMYGDPNTWPHSLEDAEIEADLKVMRRTPISRNLTSVLQDTQNIAQVLPSLVNTLQSVDIHSSEAIVNKTSIADNNGGRIQLVRDLKGKLSIKK
jgi:hypothetical protein